MNTKKCRKCGKIKEVREFSKRKDRKSGVKSRCKICLSAEAMAYRIKRNSETIEIDNDKTKKCKECEEIKPLLSFSPSKLGKDGTKSNCKDCCAKRQSEYRENNIEKLILLRKNNYDKNPDKWRKISRDRYQTDPQKAISFTRSWQKRNPEKVRKEKRLFSRKKRLTLMGGLNCRIANLIRYSLKGGKNKRHWECLVGYTLNELKSHLEKLFTDGMTWENMGLWHIDHKIPISHFHFTTPDDLSFKQCWALHNLQPLWAIDNMKKGNRRIDW
jgi:hypothetical protein